MRTPRDLLVDSAGVILAAVIGLVAGWSRLAAVGYGPRGALDFAAGALCCLALVWRRRWPVGVAVVTTLVSAVTVTPAGAALVATFSLAVHRPLPVVTRVAMAGVAGGVVSALLYPSPYLSAEANGAISLVFSAMATALVVGWGRLVRARREVLAALSERVRRAEFDKEARIAAARRAERDWLAREMHDVLAHRMSLLSVHAGALEFRPDASPEEIARGAGVIRAATHQMLTDLRAVVGVLRENAEDGAVRGGTLEDVAPPQPVLADLPQLVAEAREAGDRVAAAVDLPGDPQAPSMTSAAVYRIVQEALTNARKHAPGEPVSLDVTGAPGDGVLVTVSQPLAPQPAPPITPGGGLGLVGLAERATLAGGTLDHGAVDGRYRLTAWLPWESG
ncbi:sensory histidine kinase UhpB [Streptomyces sp. YIM 130001]|uniref:sensor histidine kinase n=1 Tax=Streptomyces sp. YIM 130001 TaxID=2259644 RepID=UPI000ECA376C|nr:histidine kinase [Streptomyces sp. YIM 130001]RII14001.1 sensory histidine kinase UhpB [Streptomyces sp. YIM 130001]